MLDPHFPGILIAKRGKIRAGAAVDAVFSVFTLVSTRLRTAFWQFCIGDVRHVGRSYRNAL
jgi:hypothetical protein